MLLQLVEMLLLLLLLLMFYDHLSSLNWHFWRVLMFIFSFPKHEDALRQCYWRWWWWWWWHCWYDMTKAHTLQNVYVFKLCVSADKFLTKCHHSHCLWHFLHPHHHRHHRHFSLLPDWGTTPKGRATRIPTLCKTVLLLLS